MANAPVSRGSTAATASCGDAPRSISRATRWPTTSVSVSLSNVRPSRDQLVAQRLEILDDAVVDQRHRPDDVRVGIADRRRAVRRPAGVGDAGDAVQRLGRQLAREIVELALGPAALELRRRRSCRCRRNHNRDIRAASARRTAAARRRSSRQFRRFRTYAYSAALRGHALAEAPGPAGDALLFAALEREAVGLDVAA